MITDRYYYNKLSSKEKNIYNLLYQNILKLQPVTKVAGCITMPVLTKIISAMTNDNPHLYYFNQTRVRLQTSVTSSLITIDFFFNKTEILMLNQKIEQAVNTIIKNLKLEYVSDEYEKEKLIHDALVTHISYDHSAIGTTNERHLATAHSIIGAFIEKKAVCEGIAKATKILCNTVNINCIVVTGNSSLEKHGGHAWNIIRINGGAYHLDVTWDVSSSTKGNVNYDYFNLSDEIISQDHSDFKDVPPCTHTEYNYFEKEKLVFNDIRSAKAYIKKQINNGNKNLYIKINSTAINIENIAQSLVQFSLSIAAQEGYRWQAQYAVNSQQNTIRLQISMVV